MINIMFSFHYQRITLMRCNELSFSLYDNHTRIMTSSNWDIFRFTGHFSGNSPVSGEFPAQRPVTRSFEVFFDLRLNKWLNKQSQGWWFETLSRPLWRHRNSKYCFKLVALIFSYMNDIGAVIWIYPQLIHTSEGFACHKLKGWHVRDINDGK